MEHIPSLLVPPTIALPEYIRCRLAGQVIADNDGALRMIVASACNWAELSSLNHGELALGDDGLIRIALWAASNCCATLVGTRRATLLIPDGDGAQEIRCHVVANAILETGQPLSGFLLKPVAVRDSRSKTRRPGYTGVHADRAEETRRALFDAFPVGDDGENVPLRGLVSS